MLMHPFLTAQLLKNVRIGLFAACVAMLAACANMHGLQPQGAMTQPDQLASRHLLAGVQLTPAAWPQSDWWKALGDPQLDGLIDTALSGNPSLDAADARTRIALAQAGAQDAARKAKVNAQAEYSGIRIPATVAPAPFGGHYLGVELLTLSVGYAPDLWGGKRAAWEATVDQAHAAQVDAQAARLTLSANIAQAWTELAHASESQDLAQRELERARALQRLTAQRVKAGIDSDIQLRQTDAAVAAAQRGVQAAQEQSALLRATLAALVGQGPDRGLQIARPQPLKTSALELPSDLPSELLSRRPDIVAARWRVEAASRGIKAAKAQFYPSINLSAAVGLASMGLSDLFSLPSRYMQLGPAISLPIFDGGRLRAGLAERDANYDLAVAQYNQTLVDALHQVAEQVITLRAIDAQVVTEQQALDAAQSAYDLGMKRYRSGVSAYLDVLAVQQPLLRAELQLTDLHAQRLLASVRLVQALGGGFEPDALPTQSIAQPTTAAR
jgi:NodT family efflux transporter outer membrane factor (OMF) lipoprotein